VSGTSKQRLGLGVKFLKFSFVGTTGVVVNTLALFLLYQMVGLPLLMASPLAIELAIANNFLLNDRWTFHQNGHSVSRFLKFNLVSLGGLVIAAGTLYALVQFEGVHYLLANLVGIGLATLWNFFVNLVWTWRQDR